MSETNPAGFGLSGQEPWNPPTFEGGQDPRKIKNNGKVPQGVNRSASEGQKERVGSSRDSAFESLQNTESKQNFTGEELSGGRNIGERLENFFKGIQDLWNSIPWSSIFSCFKGTAKNSERESVSQSKTRETSERLTSIKRESVVSKKESPPSPHASPATLSKSRTSEPSELASIFGGPGIAPKKESPPLSKDSLTDVPPSIAQLSPQTNDYSKYIPTIKETNKEPEQAEMPTSSQKQRMQSKGGLDLYQMMAKYEGDNPKKEKPANEILDLNEMVAQYQEDSLAEENPENVKAEEAVTEKEAIKSKENEEAVKRSEAKKTLEGLLSQLEKAEKAAGPTQKENIQKEILELKKILLPQVVKGEMKSKLIDYIEVKDLDALVEFEVRAVGRLNLTAMQLTALQQKSIEEMNNWTLTGFTQGDAEEILRADINDLKDKNGSFYFLLKDDNQPEKFHVTYIEKGQVVHHEIEVNENGNFAVGDQEYATYDSVKENLGFDNIRRYNTRDAKSNLEERSLSISANESHNFLENEIEGTYILRKSGNAKEERWVLDYSVGNKDFNEVRIKVLENGKYEVTDLNGLIGGNPFNTFEAIVEKLNLGKPVQQEEISKTGEKQQIVSKEMQSNQGWKTLNALSKGNSLEDAKSFINGGEYQNLYFLVKGDTPDKFHIVYQKDNEVMIHDITVKKNGHLEVGEEEFDNFAGVKSHLEDELEGLTLFSKEEARDNIDEKRIDITQPLLGKDSVNFLGESGEEGRYILRKSSGVKGEFVIDYSVGNKEFESVRVTVLENGKYDVKNFNQEAIKGSPFSSFKAIEEALELKAPYERKEIVTANEKQHKKLKNLCDKGTRPSDKEIQDYLGEGYGQYIMFPSDKEGKYVIFLPEKKYIEVTSSGYLKFEGQENRYSSFEKLKKEYGLGAPITSAEVLKVRPKPIDIEIELKKQTQTLLKDKKEIEAYLEKQEPGAYLFQKLDETIRDGLTQQASTALYFKTEKGTVARVGLNAAGPIMFVISDKQRFGQALKTLTLDKMKTTYGLKELHDDAKIGQA